MEFVVNGTRIFAEVLGDGPAIVCLHGGFGLDHSYFCPYLDDLARDHLLVLVDLRGHGRSDPLARNAFRIDAIVEDLEAIRGQLRQPHWTVLGHSGGGLIAAQYAATHPALVSHLCLVGSFPRFPFRAPGWLRLARELGDPEILSGLKMFLDGVKSDDAYRDACIKIAPLFFADPKRADCSPFDRIRYRVAPHQEAIAHYSGYDLRDPVAAYRGPVLIVHGTQDHRVPVGEGKKWLQCLPQARWVKIDKAGHFPFIEQPVEFCRVLRRFFDRASLP
ncbi:MAG: alpha/beta hydrolase [Deltaproteobacteria bacterium]|nr:alpha/beta hydrolase [Deltaproteobacteria bacterium]